MRSKDVEKKSDKAEKRQKQENREAKGEKLKNTTSPFSVARVKANLITTTKNIFFLNMKA